MRGYGTFRKVTKGATASNQAFLTLKNTFLWALHFAEKGADLANGDCLLGVHSTEGRNIFSQRSTVSGQFYFWVSYGVYEYPENRKTQQLSTWFIFV